MFADFTFGSTIAAAAVPNNFTVYLLISSWLVFVCALFTSIAVAVGVERQLTEFH